MQQTEQFINSALDHAKELATGRESALVKTKLQEALFWFHEYKKLIAIKVKERTGSMRSHVTNED